MIALAISCSKDDGDMNGGNGEQYPEISTPIVFTANQQEDETVTRAEALENYATTFTVYGYKNMSYVSDAYGDLQTVFPGYTVNWTANSAYTTTTNTDGWEYVNQQPSGEEQTIKYWDWSAKAYRFFGYTLGTATADPATDPATVTATVTDGSAVALFSSVVDASSEATIDAAPYFSRLWFSDGNLATYPDRQFGKPVQLQFLKPFARVRFMFTFIDGLSFGREALTHISFHPTRQGSSAPTIATAGTVTVTYPLSGTETVEAWASSLTTGIDAFTIDYYEPATVPDGSAVGPEDWPNVPHHWYYVLPAPSQGSYTVEVAAVTDEIKTAVVPAEYMSWKPGYDYTYIFKITEGGGIVVDIVQVAINNWSNQKSSDHAVYNW